MEVIQSIKDDFIAQFLAIKPSIEESEFGMPIRLVSDIKNNVLSGEITGIIDFPFALVRSRLDEPEDWCNALILHANTRACIYENGAIGKIHLYGGRKYYQPPQQASMITLDFIHRIQQEDLMALKLFSDQGPYDTENYLIEFTAMPLPYGISKRDTHKTLVRLSFSYHLGWLARQTVRLYLATLGHDKVGFTIVDVKQGQPVYIKGFQGIMERNTMRYYLALDTVLTVETERKAPLQRFRYWHDATQRFPLQLQEIEKEKYLANKALEMENQLRMQARINQSAPHYP